jgi:hypothetical protein
MADSKITDLTDLTTAADGDRLPIVDVSDTAEVASGKTKNITVANLATAIISAGSIATDAEVTAAVAAHTGDSTAAHAASAISFTPAGTIAGTDVQTAVAEVATDAATALAAHEAAGDPHPGYTTAAELATHAGLTSSVHGISAFGATLVDDANAAAARTTLELGTAATAAQADLLARANHTGTQTASTISDFAEAVDDEVATFLVAGSGITLTHNDPGNSLTIAASGGGIVSDYTSDNQFYFLRDTISPGSNLGGTDVSADGVLILHYITVPTACQIDGASIRLNIAGSAGERCRLVIYDVANGAPTGAALLNSGDVALDVAAPAYLLPTWSAVSFSPGLYLAGVMGTGATHRLRSLQNTVGPEASTGSTGTHAWGFRGGFTYGSSPPTSPSVIPWDTFAMPFIKWRVQL